MIKAVILDLDDTLFMSFESAFIVVNMIIREMGSAPITRAALAEHWGAPVHQASKRWGMEADPAEFAEKFIAHFPTAVKDGVFDVLTPENMTALKTLKKTDKLLFVVTSRVQGELSHLLDPRHELAGIINKFYYKDNMKFHKPDPMAFRHIEDEYSLSPQECVYVGDSLGDAAAATGAGLHFIASLESGLKTKEDFAEYAVDAFIHKFPEVVDAVLTIEAS